MGYVNPLERGARVHTRSRWRWQISFIFPLYLGRVHDGITNDVAGYRVWIWAAIHIHNAGNAAWTCHSRWRRWGLAERTSGAFVNDPHEGDKHTGPIRNGSCSRCSWTENRFMIGSGQTDNPAVVAPELDFGTRAAILGDEAARECLGWDRNGGLHCTLVPHAYALQA